MMRRIKIKLNYGNDFRVFDATLSITDQKQGTGFVIALGQLELERYVFLAPGQYLAQAIYDLPGDNGGKKTCLIETTFLSEETERLAFNLKKPTSIIPGFTQPEMNDLEGILSSTVGGKIYPRSEQVFAHNTVKSFGKLGGSLDERVVIDKNGKVEYIFNFNEPEYDDEAPPTALVSPVTTGNNSHEATVRVYSSPIEELVQPSLRPYTVHALNYGYWNIGLYGLNTNIGKQQQQYRDVRSTAFLRPRSELFNRLPDFIMENMRVARIVNGIN